ncbi:ketose-bisphosphate aldolase [Peptoniphilus equinus]|uniref:Ketose-bisphosphate aldolase n=1 Tax=Peptoniphilus equinus TaxID=3016343 RepID=A0ABY7QSS7_9FIRM|nr:ketose-bisphosphate aldolase [Peptoniphilus equinus]WBW49381.1 ketose-bisphosphate aldolase [Peptoniphilus equinus]
MSLVTMEYLVQRAWRDSSCIPAFNVGSLEMIRGAVQAAEALNKPIIIQIAERLLHYSPLEYIGPAMVSAAKEATVDVAVNMDHSRSMHVITKALELGFTSVMYDGSMDTFDVNIQGTRQVVARAKTYGASVEGELGLVGGSEDGLSDHGIQCTNPDLAREFCEKTGISALAVAIGNAHGDYPTAPELAFDILDAINERAQIPLVLHGGSGLSDDDFRKAVSLGIAKINIGTASFNKVTQFADNYLSSAVKPDYFGLNEAMTEGMYENAIKHIKVFTGMA